MILRSSEGKRKRNMAIRRELALTKIYSEVKKKILNFFNLEPRFFVSPHTKIKEHATPRKCRLKFNAQSRHERRAALLSCLRS